MTMPEALRPVAFSALAGWHEDDHEAALAAFRRSASEILEHGHGFIRQSLYGGTRDNWLAVCAKAQTAKHARRFFEEEFQAFKVSEPALFTGYYEPQVEGRLRADDEFTVPLYAKPPELIAFTEAEKSSLGLGYGRRTGNGAQPFFTRQEIESGALRGRGLELCYLRSWVDAYFIHIQGSARIKLAQGESLHLSFAGKNGHPYASLGKELLNRHIGDAASMSMLFIRQWMAQHPQEARQLMWHNPSFIFFRAMPEPHAGLGAIGAGKVNLTPQRSLAVDRSQWALGTPFFVETTCPMQKGPRPFHHLLVAQDTGSAIKGAARGDIYFGWGEEAGWSAGHMKHRGSLVALLPKALAGNWLK